MRISTIAPSKPQKLTLVEMLEKRQFYDSVAEPHEIQGNRLSMFDLSDINVSGLVTLARTQHPELLNDDKDYVLVEGVMDKPDKYLQLTLVVTIKYNFARNKPLIDVPGSWMAPSFDPRGVHVGLLDENQRMRFIDYILLKHIATTDFKREYIYTGNYRIWPGVEIDLKSRTIPI